MFNQRAASTQPGLVGPTVARFTSKAPTLIKSLVIAVLASWFIAATAGEKLTSEQLADLLVGNTETGYSDGSSYSEFYDVDGVVKGRWGTEKYTGRYEVRDGGCFHVDYDDGNDYDGCYHFQHIKDNSYKATHESGTSNEVKILQGNARNL